MLHKGVYFTGLRFHVAFCCVIVHVLLPTRTAALARFGLFEMGWCAVHIHMYATRLNSVRTARHDRDTALGCMLHTVLGYSKLMRRGL
jgi:hypothetical protein